MGKLVLVRTPVGNLQDVTLRLLDTLREAPGIYDPGFLVVRACIENELEVTCLPGATAFVPALVASGFPCDRFVFEGFLPHKKGRQTKWKSFVDEDRTIVLY